jgi:hypothetical protein
MKGNKMSKVLDDLKIAVTNKRSVAESVLTLVTLLVEKLNVAITKKDINSVAEITTQLSANSQNLVNAVVANTPAVEHKPVI